MQNEAAYQRFCQESKQADDLHALLVSIAEDEDWYNKHPFTALSKSNLHTFALMKGLITAPERELLRRYII